MESETKKQRTGDTDDEAPKSLSSPSTASLVFKVLRLDYFALLGLGEEIRLVLEEVGAAYDSCYHFGGSESQKKLKEISPTGQMPVFSDPSMGKGFHFSQSAVILRHLARKYSLFPTDPAELIRTDMVYETARDVRAKKNMLWDEALKPKLMDFMQHFEGMLGDADYFGGDKINLADIVAFHSLQIFEEIKPGALTDLEVPKLEQFRKRFAARPRTAVYLASPRRFPITINELGDPARPWRADGYVYTKPLEWSRILEAASRE